MNDFFLNKLKQMIQEIEKNLQKLKEHERYYVLPELNKMEKNIREIMQLQNISSLNRAPGISQLLFDLQWEFEKFRNYLESSYSDKKTIVGFGGGFSAGKSSLLNAIIGRKLLPTGIDPTSAVPVYVFKEKEEKYEVINTSGEHSSLGLDEFVVLTHDFKKNSATPGKSVLKSAHISLPDFPWENLVFLDTPGYSKSEGEKESIDAEIAREQLNSANIIIWMIPSLEGTITESDLRFLSRLNPNIPKLFVLSQTDLKIKKDISNIQTLVRKTLEERKIDFLDIIPFSTRKKQYPIVSISAHDKTLMIAGCSLFQWFDQWDKQKFKMPFSEKFGDIFNSIYNSINELYSCKTFFFHFNFYWPDSFLKISKDFFSHLEDIGKTVGISVSKPPFKED